MKIIKFGGSSVGEDYSIEQICYILNDKKNQEDRYAIIVSAISGITDNLVKCAQYAEKKNEKYHLIIDEIELKHLDMIQKLFKYFNKKSLMIRIIKYIHYLEILFDSICKITYFSKNSLDKIMNFGELISSYLINEKLKEDGFNSFWKDSRELIIIKNRHKQVNFLDSYLKIKYFFIKINKPYIILPGFIASTDNVDAVTLGRGGSDYSASIFSAALQAEFLEIWTDVSGMMTAPPKIVFNSFPQKSISFFDVVELSHFGAKVIYPPTLIPSIRNNIPIIIKNTFSPLERGTFIYNINKGKGLVTGITGIQNLTSFIKEEILNIPNYIIRNNNFYSFIKETLNIFINTLTNPITKIKELNIITIIMNDMKNIQIAKTQMFHAIEQEYIKLYFIISSEKNISAIIEKRDFIKSMNILHDIFFENPYKKVHIFITGLGKVGNNLIKQLYKQKNYLIEELRIHIKIIAICNSKRMYYNINGINFKKWKKYIRLGTLVTLKDIKHRLYNLTSQHNFFIDNTDSKEIANLYIDFLVKRIGIITCNKIACASSYYEYKNIKDLAKHFKVPFLFETNVGAGLPIINTLNYLTQSGDKIHFIYAVLSGSLNFILKENKGYFMSNIKKAKINGLTEPDPRIDLSGIDILRKILILIREYGEKIESEDIKQTSLLPKMCIKSSTEDSFYKEIIFNEDFFTQQRLAAKEQRKRIIYMAKYKYSTIYLVLKNIDFKHPFYQLEGKDNMILYTTERYIHQPLLIKGAGAGAPVTASRVFSDIIQAAI